MVKVNSFAIKVKCLILYIVIRIGESVILDLKGPTSKRSEGRMEGKKGLERGESKNGKGWQGKGGE